MPRTFQVQAGDKHWVQHPLVLGELATAVLIATALEKELLQTSWQAAGSASKCQVAFQGSLYPCRLKVSCRRSKVVQAGFAVASLGTLPL